MDAAFSLEPDELKNLVIETERAFLAMGKIQYGVQESEKKSLMFKRSIFVSENIKPGEIFTSKNIKVIRPGFGLEPYFYERLLGRVCTKSLEAGKPLRIDDII